MRPAQVDEERPHGRARRDGRGDRARCSPTCARRGGRHRHARPVPPAHPRARARSPATSHPRASARSSETARSLGFPTVYSGVFVRSPSTRKRWRREHGCRSEPTALEREGLAAALRPAPLPLLPEVRARGGRLGGPRAAARRPPRRAGAGTRVRLGYVTGAVVGAGPPVLDGARRHPVRRPQPAGGHRGHGRSSASRSRSFPRSSPGWSAASSPPSARPGCSSPPSPGWPPSSLRTHTFFRFPWCLLGYSQHATPAVHPDRVGHARSTASRSCSSWRRPSWPTWPSRARPARAGARSWGSCSPSPASWAWGSWRSLEPVDRDRAGSASDSCRAGIRAGREVGPGERLGERRASTSH